MTARDRFQTSLECPTCGASGVADVSETDGISYYTGGGDRQVDHVSEGFAVANASVVTCVRCGTNVTPT